jgi:hypothetical protein
MTVAAVRTSVVGGLLLAVTAALAVAQRPGGGPGGAPGRPDGDDLVARMMEFDKDQDGKLTRSEVTDARLHRVFDRADADQDGVVTRDELTALATREAARASARGGPPGPPPGGPGGPMMGPPRPGEILSPMLQQRLGLTADQRAQLAELQREVDGKLATILSDEQKAELKAMQQRGPGRFGPSGGGRGPGPGPRGDRPPPPADPRP